MFKTIFFNFLILIPLILNGAQEAINAPIITKMEWAEIVVLDNNQIYIYNDAKLWPSKSKKWDWKEKRHERRVPPSHIRRANRLLCL